MQRIRFLSVALLMGFCFHPLPLFGQDLDQSKSDTKDAASAPKAAKETPKAAKQVHKASSKTDVLRSDKTARKSDAAITAGGNQSANAGNFEKSTRSVQQTTQRQSNTKTVAVQGTRSNNYNGQWVAGNTHSDWSRSADHQWNNHDYRWYDGGWLIVSVGSSPVYYDTGAIVIRVKESLSQQGYYTGHFTESVGPRTRQAISNYQSDKGMQVSGEIDQPLIASLGLE